MGAGTLREPREAVVGDGLPRGYARDKLMQARPNARVSIESAKPDP
jgi:hypothetical protein